MYLEIFQADFAVFRVFLGISRDFAEIPEFRGSATARNVRHPEIGDKLSSLLGLDCETVLILLTTSTRNAVRREKRILNIILALDLPEVDVTTLGDF